MAASGTTLLGRFFGGGWLDRRRVRLGAALLLGFEVAAFLFLIAGTHGWIVPLDNPTTTDFVSFYAAGLLANAGVPALAYDHAVHLATEEAVTAVGIQYQFFNYPPVFLMVCAALAHLPYMAAFILFQAATLLLYLLAARRILDDRSGTALLVLLAFPGVFWNIGLGQNAFLTAALFGAGTLWVDRRPILAGLCFGALCYKPHFGLLLPLALAAGGHWRAFAAAALSALALVAASLGLFGWDAWQAFSRTAGASHTMYESGRILFGGFVSPFGAVRLVGGSVPVAYAMQAAASLAAAAAVAIVWRRCRSLPIRAAVLASATLVAVPLSLLYDLMLAAVAGAGLVRDRREAGAARWERVVFAALFLVVLNGRNLAELWHLPLLTLAVAALFALSLRRAWRAMAPTGAPTGAAPAGSGAARPNGAAA